MSVASTAAKVLFGRDLLRLAVESVGFLVLGFAAVVFVILLLLKSLLGLATSSANLGLLPGPDSGASDWTACRDHSRRPARRHGAGRRRYAVRHPLVGPGWGGVYRKRFRPEPGPIVGRRLRVRAVHARHLAQLRRQRAMAHERSRRAGQGAVAAAGLQQLSLRATGHGSVSVHDGRGVRHRLVSGRSSAASALLLQPRPRRRVRPERRLRERRARLRPAGRRRPGRPAVWAGGWPPVDDRLRLQTTLWRGPVQRRRAAAPRAWTWS